MTLIKIDTKIHKDFAFTGCEGCQNVCCENDLYISQFSFHEVKTVANLFPIFFQKQVDENIFLPTFFYSLQKGVPCIYLDKNEKKCTKWNEARPLSCTLFPFSVDQKSKAPILLYQDSCAGCRSVTAADKNKEVMSFIKEGKCNEEIITHFVTKEFADASIRDQRYYETLGFTKFCQKQNLFEQLLVIETNLKFPVRFDESFQIYYIPAGKEEVFLTQGDCDQETRKTYLEFYSLHMKSLGLINKLIVAYQEHQSSQGQSSS